MNDEDLINTAKTLAEHESNPGLAILLSMLAERLEFYSEKG